MTRLCTAGIVLAVLAGPGLAQSSPLDTLVAILKPALPYPEAAPAGDVPAEGGADARWFVIWPDGDRPARIIVRANPLHPETQAISNAAMAAIQETIVAAERRAQAEYDRVMEQLRRTGKGADLQGIALDDEGIAGERIDAELELTIDLEVAQAATELIGATAPSVSVTNGGAIAIVRLAAHTYREDANGVARERFRPAEARIYFGMSEPPAVARRGPARHLLTLSPATGGVVVLRGNEALIEQLIAGADWSRLGTAP